MKKQLIHVIAGSDEWKPTKGELDDLTKTVMGAILDPKGAVVATRSEVEILVIEIDTDDSTLVTVEAPATAAEMEAITSEDLGEGYNVYQLEQGVRPEIDVGMHVRVLVANGAGSIISSVPKGGYTYILPPELDFAAAGSAGEARAQNIKRIRAIGDAMRKNLRAAGWEGTVAIKVTVREPYYTHGQLIEHVSIVGVPTE